MRRGVAAGLFDVVERHRPEKPSKTPMIMPPAKDLHDMV